MENGSEVEKYTVKMWRIFKTIHQLVHDRGYFVSQAELDLTLPEFIQTFCSNNVITDRSALNFRVHKSEDSSDKLFVFFSEDASVGVKSIRTFVEMMNEQGVHKAILIVKQSLTSSAAKVLFWLFIIIIIIFLFICF